MDISLLRSLEHFVGPGSGPHWCAGVELYCQLPQEKFTEATMRHDPDFASTAGNRWAAFGRSLLPSLALLMGALSAGPATGAEIEVLGTGTFKPLTPEHVAIIPADLPFSRADLTSGRWSFIVRYEESTADSEPDPHIGRYGRAIRAFRLTVGSTTIDLPVDHAEILISDGGQGFPERESIRIQTSTPAPYGVIQVAWIQTHQTASRMDLRGAAGLLASDTLPPSSMMAHLPTDRRFDRFFLLRVDSPSQTAPLLYLSSSQMRVSARPAGEL